MINAEISLVIPDFSGYSPKDAWEEIGQNLEISIKKNFVEGGRPKWIPKKDGTPSNLFKSGTLFSSIIHDSNDVMAEAGMNDGHNPIYGFAQQFGYTPRNLVARPFVLFQDEDKEMATRIYGESILKFWQTQGQPV